jgi:beta-glucanase (GH16 family)
MDRSFGILLTIIYFFVFFGYVGAEENKGKIIFREDFYSKKLSSSTWGYATFSMYKFKGDPDMVSNSSGINYLRLGQPGSDIYPSGFIFTREHFYFGSYSARMKVSDVNGAVASFFACTEVSGTAIGTMDEIDFEFITARPHSVLLTTWGEAIGNEGKEQTSTHNSFLWEDPSFDIREWHVYRFDWYPDRVDFYIDGIKRWVSTIAVPQRPMQITLHIYTIDTWEEVQFPPKGEALQMTDWVEYREFQ